MNYRSWNMILASAVAVFWLAAGQAWGKPPLIKRLTSEAMADKVRNDVPSESGGGGIYEELKVHSLGVGLGQTFVRGHLARHGEDKITLDGYYNYSVSHSFDMVLNFHYSQHVFTRRKSCPAGGIGWH